MNTTTELLDLRCKECEKPYQKPAIYKDWLKERTQNVFFKWSLDYCDECRRAKERAALTKLPQVLELLSQSLEPNTDTKSDKP